MTLEVLICTIDNGIQSIPHCLLPPREGISYLVSFQYTNESFRTIIPSTLLERKDVHLCYLKGIGLSRNRNNALVHASGDILLIADDDVCYKPEYFERIFMVFQQNPTVDVACFQAIDKEGLPLHYYAAHRFAYSNQPYGVFFCSVEIAFRRKSILFHFDERFGIGSPYLGGGEDEVFLLDAHKAGLNIVYFPFVIVETDACTTGTRMLEDRSILRAKGAVLYLMHGFISAWLRCLKFSLQSHKKKNPLRLLYSMTAGIFYILKTTR
ncbi:MAG: glycosyltransferase [Bacteroidaceae bacterium]